MMTSRFACIALKSIHNLKYDESFKSVNIHSTHSPNNQPLKTNNERNFAFSGLMLANRFVDAAGSLWKCMLSLPFNAVKLISLDLAFQVLYFPQLTS